MVRARRIPVLVVVAVVLAVTGYATTRRPPVNPTALPSGLAVSMNAESTALYCTGLTSSPGAPARVIFYNTASVARHLAVSVVSNDGRTATSTLELAGHASESLVPSTEVVGTAYAVAVQISGGGVVGEEVAGTRRADVPCAAEGVSQWYAAGLDTLVGSSATLSVYNPTATAAVFSVTLYSGAGISAPQSLQGLSVPAHAQRDFALNADAVDTRNIGVGVTVSRGTLVLVGVEDSRGTVSLEQGSLTPSNAIWFPEVTTARFATAEVRVANPGATTARVSVSVTLRRYAVAPFQVTVAPFSTGLVTITPDSAIPVAGYASLVLRSSQPVVAALATGTGSSVLLSSPAVPTGAFLIRNFTGRGFDAATVTNTGLSTVDLSLTSLHDRVPHVVNVVRSLTLAPGASFDLAHALASLRRATDFTYLVTANRPSIVVTLTLPSRPAGVDLVAALDGR